MTIKPITEKVEHLPDRAAGEVQPRQEEFNQLVAQANAILDDGTADGVLFSVIPANTEEGEGMNVADFRCFGGEKLLFDLGQAVFSTASHPALGRFIQAGMASAAQKSQSGATAGGVILPGGNA